MIELYFLIYRIPKMMSRLARERNRSPVAWSLITIAAWLAAELIVGLGIGLTYGLLAIANDWPLEIPVGLRLLTYVLALGAAIGSCALVKRYLSGRPVQDLPLPPPPPRF
jgi:hypothetical protein